MFKQRYYRNINTLSLCSPVLLSGNVQSDHVAAGKVFKQRYYRNINTLSLCRPVLLSGNSQSEHIAAGDVVQTTILMENFHCSSYFQVTSNLNISQQGKWFKHDIIGTLTY